MIKIFKSLCLLADSFTFCIPQHYQIAVIINKLDCTQTEGNGKLPTGLKGKWKRVPKLGNNNNDHCGNKLRFQCSCHFCFVWLYLFPLGRWYGIWEHVKGVFCLYTVDTHLPLLSLDWHKQRGCIISSVNCKISVELLIYRDYLAWHLYFQSWQRLDASLCGKGQTAITLRTHAQPQTNNRQVMKLFLLTWCPFLFRNLL